MAANESSTVPPPPPQQQKKRFFSSQTKQQRQVFNMKNFWSDAPSNRRSMTTAATASVKTKTMSNKSSSSSTAANIFDVQYRWRPKTTIDTNDNNNGDTDNCRQQQQQPPVAAQRVVTVSAVTAATAAVNNTRRQRRQPKQQQLSPTIPDSTGYTVHSSVSSSSSAASLSPNNGNTNNNNNSHEIYLASTPSATNASQLTTRTKTYNRQTRLATAAGHTVQEKTVTTKTISVVTNDIVVSSEAMDAAAAADHNSNVSSDDCLDTGRNSVDIDSMDITALTTTETTASTTTTTTASSVQAITTPDDIVDDDDMMLPTTELLSSNTTDTVTTTTTTTSDTTIAASPPSSMSSMITTTTTIADTSTAASDQVIAAAAKPKRKIFSSLHKKNRTAVFNTKNFWTSGTMDFTDDDGNPIGSESMTATSASSGGSTGAASASGATTTTAAGAANKNKLSDEFDKEDDYVVLHRVKKAHQCHDLGETEQFDDDIKYHLSGIDVSNSSAMRCLSILGLTQQAMRPEFRMHLRAHDDMPRIISALMDAPTDANLALCTACLMFVYSQDRLTMDIDPNALALMLQLLETRSDECNGVDSRHRDKVKEMCEQMKNKGIHVAKYLKLTEITAGNLAMETLLGLTSKRAGDWFKEELRRIKGIDFILDTVLRCAEQHEDEGLMIKIDRCMHVLENVTLNNTENQVYLLEYKNGLLISTCIRLLHSCKYRILASNDSKVFLSAFFSILRVLTHLTSESVDGCSTIGSYDGIIDLLLESIIELPSFIMSDQRFDLMVILLCLCINLVEFCPQMRDLVINNRLKLRDIIDLLFRRIQEAQRTEQQTDELLESHEKVQMTEAMRDSLLHTMLSQSGNHMEHSIIAACISLLLGCTIQDNMRYTNAVRDTLPNGSFDPLVEVLQKLRDFAYLADIMTKKGKERVDRIIQVFKAS